jgi:hypothetical protein
LVAPNAYEYALWTRGFELIVRHFQDKAAEARALAQHALEEAAEAATDAEATDAEAGTEAGGGGEGLALARAARPRRGQLSVYDRGNYLAFQPLPEPELEPARPSSTWATSAAAACCWQEEAQADEEEEEQEKAGREPRAALSLTPVICSPSKTTPASSLSPLPPLPSSTREPGKQEEEPEAAATPRRQPRPVPATNGLPVLIPTTNGGGGGEIDRGVMEEAWSPSPSSPASSLGEHGGPVLLPLEEDGGDGAVMRGASFMPAANGKPLTSPGREEREEEEEEGEDLPLPLDPRDIYANSAFFLHFVHDEGAQGQGSGGGGGGGGGGDTSSSSSGNAVARR